MTDPFDLNDVSDLPEDMQNKKGTLGSSRNSKMMVLFNHENAPENLTIPAIEVAYFREHGEKLGHPEMSATLQSLCRTGQIQRIGRGKYRLMPPEGSVPKLSDIASHPDFGIDPDLKDENLDQNELRQDLDEGKI